MLRVPQPFGLSSKKRSHVMVREDFRGIHLVSSIATDRQYRGSFFRIR